MWVNWVNWSYCGKQRKDVYPEIRCGCCPWSADCSFPTEGLSAKRRLHSSSAQWHHGASEVNRKCGTHSAIVLKQDWYWGVMQALLRETETEIRLITSEWAQMRKHRRNATQYHTHTFLQYVHHRLNQPEKPRKIRINSVQWCSVLDVDKGS